MSGLTSKCLRSRQSRTAAACARPSLQVPASPTWASINRHPCRVSGQNLYQALKAINARPAGELLAGLMTCFAVPAAPAGNVIPLHGQRRGGEGVSRP